MNNWFKFVLTTIVIVAISLMYSMYQQGKIQEHADECERLGQAALLFINDSPYYNDDNNFTYFTPDHLHDLVIYMNLSTQYFECEAGRVRGGKFI